MTTAGPLGLNPDVLIVGAGPAGLTAAASLARAISGVVLVVDRERSAGGIPRHSDHVGFGTRDLRRFMRGPAYARRLVDNAVEAGATIRTQAMVTGWDAQGRAQVTTPDGLLLIDPKATVLATGARERPRSARLIPGDRPLGIFTTGQLQNLVHVHHGAPGKQAVVVGAELVSWSAVMTLHQAGCRTVAMTTTHSSPESYAALALAGRMAIRTQIATRTRVVGIVGASRVEAVDIENLDTGLRRRIDCDTVVFTGDWIPDNELARAAGVTLDSATRGPQVDGGLRTSRPGLFAIGNLVHPVDTADVAALDGRHVTQQVASWLAGSDHVDSSARLLVEPPLLWISPGEVRASSPPPARRRLLSWTAEFIRYPIVRVSQRGKVVGRQRLAWPAAPGRVFRIPSGILSGVDVTAGDVTIAIASH